MNNYQIMNKDSYYKNHYENKMPLFYYFDANNKIVSDGYYRVTTDYEGWKVEFLQSGTLIFAEEAPECLDVFLVGGGAGGVVGSNSAYGNGGSGGYTKRGIIALDKNSRTYEIKIGAGGATNGAAGADTSAFGLTAKGATAKGNGGSGGGMAGSSSENGGAGGSNGENGKTTTVTANTHFFGQGFTTAEFYEKNGKLYAGGGGGSGVTGGAGTDGGGAGGSGTSANGTDAAANTGGGGGGCYNSKTPGKGGSGIVIIRNPRITTTN